MVDAEQLGEDASFGLSLQNPVLMVTTSLASVVCPHTGDAVFHSQEVRHYSFLFLDLLDNNKVEAVRIKTRLSHTFMKNELRVFFIRKTYYAPLSMLQFLCTDWIRQIYVIQT